MKWRDILIRSAVTLIVTVLGGVIIFYLTREPKVDPKEHILYSTDGPTTFEFQNSKFTTASVLFTNGGTKAASNLRAEITFPSGHIRDKKITSQSGADNELTTLSDATNVYSFALKRLLPTDSVKLSFALDPGTSEPKVTARSDETIASNAKEALATHDTGRPNSLARSVLTFMIPTMILLFLVTAFMFNRRSSC
jgi:hypothetical protein